MIPVDGGAGAHTRAASRESGHGARHTKPPIAKLLVAASDAVRNGPGSKVAGRQWLEDGSPRGSGRPPGHTSYSPAEPSRGSMYPSPRAATVGGGAWVARRGGRRKLAVTLLRKRAYMRCLGARVPSLLPAHFTDQCDQAWCP